MNAIHELQLGERNNFDPDVRGETGRASAIRATLGQAKNLAQRLPGLGFQTVVDDLPYFDLERQTYDRVACPGVEGYGLVTVLYRSLISLCHLCFERQRADATQI